MKKFAVAIVAILFLALPGPARGAVSYYPMIAPLISPYSCSATGFSLTKQQNTYRLLGPVYVPLAGYTSALSTITFNTPANGQATLTLIAPQNTINPRPLSVVPPFWVDYSFVSDAPIRELTIYINKPFTGNGAPITCLQTGVIQ